MSQENDILEIWVSGDSDQCQRFRASEIADLIKDLESTIIPVIKREDPDLDEDQIVISINSVGKGSVKIALESEVPVNSGTAKEAFETISGSIRSNDLSNLPYSSKKPLYKISKFSKRKKCRIEFREHEDNKDLMAEIGPDSEIEEPERKYIQGNTTIHGEILRVGGATTPKVVLKQPNGNTIYCDANEELARKLGERLYSWVVVDGSAKWDLEDYHIESFTIDSVTEFETEGINQSLNRFKKKYGDYFNKANVESMIDEREGDTE